MGDTNQAQDTPGPFDKEKAEGSEKIVDRELDRENEARLSGSEDKSKDGKTS